jgi:hypothetical protein
MENTRKDASKAGNNRYGCIDGLRQNSDEETAQARNQNIPFNYTP